MTTPPTEPLLPTELLRVLEPLCEPPKERVGAEPLCDDEPTDEPLLREGVNVLRGTPLSELLPVEG